MIYSKDLRLSLVIVLYTYWFWEEKFQETLTLENLTKIYTDFAIDYDYLDKPDTKDISQFLYLFWQKKVDLILKLSQFTKNWDNTFSIVKSCLSVGYLEIIENYDFFLNPQNQQEQKKMMNDYTKIAEQFSSNKSATLVHAIFTKILNQN